MQSRQLVLDTETTGLDGSDRIVEIACIEILDGKITDNKYQTYINPERDSHPEALKVHGLTTEFLSTQPKFIDIVDDFLKFVSGAEIIIHYAPFDVKFLTRELNLIGKKSFENYCGRIIDTKTMAQDLYTKDSLISELISKHLIEDEIFVKELRTKIDNDEKIISELVKNPKFRVHSLDHLCKFYKIDLSKRKKNHGALIDCELLAPVYFNLQEEQKKRQASSLETSTLQLLSQLKISVPEKELAAQQAKASSMLDLHPLSFLKTNFPPLEQSKLNFFQPINPPLSSPSIPHSFEQNSHPRGTKITPILRSYK